RLEHCKFGNGKSTCQKCPVHCYKPQMRERMRAVMRWSGPRMLLYYPIDAIKHLIRNK
ncbi:MAG: nitrous oxide-stimulated promoter family protein, partial [Bacteroidaceae bacterium]|nr:nitrous oxide-stimulated promoter family protein [Bacteroidaceae bacterium]